MKAYSMASCDIALWMIVAIDSGIVHTIKSKLTIIASKKAVIKYIFRHRMFKCMRITIEKIRRLFRKASKDIGRLRNAVLHIVRSLAKGRHISIVEDLDVGLLLRINPIWVSSINNFFEITIKAFRCFKSLYWNLLQLYDLCTCKYNYHVCKHVFNGNKEFPQKTLLYYFDIIVNFLRDI